MNIYVLREDKIDESLNLITICKDLSRKYKKILFYYTGHAKNSGDEFPVIRFNEYRISIYTLHKYMEQKFIFSILLCDACNYDASRGGNKEIFTTLNPVKNCIEKDLCEIFNNRGHLCITSAKKGKLATGYRGHGGVFSRCMLEFLREHKSWVHAFQASTILMHNFKFDQSPYYNGYILGIPQKYVKETEEIIFKYKYDPNNMERNKSLEERELFRTNSHEDLLKALKSSNNNINKLF